MFAKLSTHVLDLTLGQPAAGMTVELWRIGSGKIPIYTITTNPDGRSDHALLTEAEMLPGAYELVFFVRDYFADRGVDCTFLDRVPIRFSIPAPANYHVPLLVTPWSYSTYRGS